MASTKEFAAYVTEQLSLLDGIRTRPMMGEYVLYYREKVIGGLYDDRLMVKGTPCAKALLPAAAIEPPYPGAKPMIAVDCVENKEKLKALFEAMYEELPAPKPKKKIVL